MMLKRKQLSTKIIYCICKFFVKEVCNVMLLFMQVSGSAAKLGKDKGYHHFTLLLDVDKSNLHSLLRPNPRVRCTTSHQWSTQPFLTTQLRFPSSNATPSIPSPTINLSSVAGSISWQPMCEAISDLFYEQHGVHQSNRKVVLINHRLPKLL